MVQRYSPSRSLLFFQILSGTIALHVFLLSVATANDRQVSRRVDEFVEQNLRKHGIKPNPPASDEVFLRRAYLDIVGRIPTHKEAQQFLGSESSSKRGQLIHHLLQSEGYVSHWFNYWADILRVKSRMDGARGAGEAYADWVKEALRSNKSYREIVHELITAEGYVWDNGAVGYYLRDSGMPLDNMSNTAQIFLGTQLVCAQCHNHPFDRWKQKEYYEMAAYTYGMETRANPEKILRLDERVSKMEKRANRRESSRELNRHVRSALRDLLEPLSYRVSHDEEKMLRLPSDYQYDDAKPREEVQADTIFGKRVSGRSSRKLASYADWLTGTDNPRFTRVIVNRLWKAVMGVGLIEPVDDFKDDTQPSNPALMNFLEKEMLAVDYDLRRFLGILYNTRTYQRESTLVDVDLADYHFPGPVLRRMSAEQIWDSLLTATMPGVDERKGSSSDKKRYESMKKQVHGLEAMKKQPQKILATAKAMAQVEYEHEEATKDLRKRLAAARENGNDGVAKRLNDEMKQARKERDSEVKDIRESFEAAYMGAASGAMGSMTMMRMDEKKSTKKDIDDRPDPRWKGFDKSDVRASELRSPMPSDHFLRQFGQSDRETIQAAESEASVAQALNLLNGKVLDKLVSSKSMLMKGVEQLYGDDEKQDFIFMSLLTRLPSDAERALMDKEFAGVDSSEEACESIIWALLNTKELLFVQ